GLSSFLMQYPTESVRWVDAGVRNVTGLIASGFSEGKVLPKGSASADQATGAVDSQMDSLIRDTQYRTWLGGVFGDPDSAIARQYGPRVFRSTHFSFAEYAAYRSDPNGEGKKILDAKRAAFKEHAEAIKQADPVAYEAFTGKNWTSRATSALVNLFVVAVPCIFLLLAGLFALMGFVLIRLVVPLAPAAGVIFMFDKTRDLAIGWLKRVTGPLLMGPVCFLVALVLLRFTSAIFEAERMWFVLKLGLIAVLTMIAFRLSGVMSMVPGYEHVRRRIAAALGTAVSTAVGAATGAQDGLQSEETALGATARPAAELAIAPGGVWHPTLEARAPSPQLDLWPPDDFVPYTPPPRQLGAAASITSTAPSVPAPEEQARTQYAWPIGPHPLIRARDRFLPPAVNRTITTAPLGPRTRFPPRTMTLEPNTAYMVPGRGTYFTDDGAAVRYVDAIPGTTGNLNWDLNYPDPGVTYVVGDRFVYMTDPETRTVRAIDVQSASADAPRSQSIQSAVGGAGGKGYDGGHLHQNAHGGVPERINIVAMLQELNRSGSTEFGTIPNSFYAFEERLRGLVKSGRNVSVDLKIEYPRNSTGRTPRRIRADYTIDGVQQPEEYFRNVRTRRNREADDGSSGRVD
ncbi:MAG: DNA/RNA non-specific endonuclease, partial [Pseudonocardiaceae bacterium]